MKLIVTMVIAVGLAPFTAMAFQDKGWRGIVPLHSMRADVERLLGSPDDPKKEHSVVYNTSHETVIVDFATGQPCDSRDGWNVSSGTVTDLVITPKRKFPVDDLGIDLSAYTRRPDQHRPDIVTFVNEDRGESITVYQGEVQYLHYFPSASDAGMGCSPERSQRIDRQYHPLDSYENVSFEDEKPRLDNFAINLVENDKAKGYIVIHRGPRMSSRESRARAARAKNYLVSVRGLTSARVITIDAGKSDKFLVELYVVPNGLLPPFARR